MSKVLTSKKIALNTRKRIVQCYIWSTLQYGVETWTITGSMAKRLSACEMWCYRRMLRISWTEKVSNEEVLERAKIKKRLYNIIQTKKLQYFGHIIRQNGDTLHRTVLHGKVNGSRGCGRPRTKWTTNITKWTGLEYHQAVRQAQHRQEWRTIASNPRQEDGTWWWWRIHLQSTFIGTFMPQNNVICWNVQMSILLSYNLNIWISLINMFNVIATKCQLIKIPGYFTWCWTFKTSNCMQCECIHMVTCLLNICLSQVLLCSKTCIWSMFHDTDVKC